MFSGKRAAALVVASLFVLPPAGDAATPPNIVFIAVDDQTYKFTSTFGSLPVQTTPTLDALAERGVRFTNGIVQGTQCAPSRNSTITGRYPHQLGYYENGDLYHVPFRFEGFPASLRAAGYYTAWIGKAHLEPYTRDLVDWPGINRTTGMRRQFGFDEVIQHQGRWVSLQQASRWLQESALGVPWPRGDNIYLDYLFDRGLAETLVAGGTGPTSLAPDDYMDGYISRRAEDWIAAWDGGQPFFLYINYSAPHDPFDQPAEFQSLFAIDDLPPMIEDANKQDIPLEMKRRRDKFSPERRNAHRIGHASMITYQDAQLARVLAALEEKGIRDRTLIVYYSDHGVMNGDHGLYKKGTLYREVLHANLVIDLPDDAWPERARVVTRPVELLDAVQTALDAAGVPSAERDYYEGKSLLPLLTDAVSGSYNRRHAFAQVRGATAAVTARWTYVDHPDVPVLFDRQTDPEERENVVARPGNEGVVAEFRMAMADFYARTGRPRAVGGKRVPPASIAVGEFEFLAPPYFGPLRGDYASLALHRDSSGSRWGLLSGGDPAAWCAAAGGALAGERAVSRLADWLNAGEGRLALVRAGWPNEGRRGFVTADPEDRILRFDQGVFVLSRKPGYRGHPLCLRVGGD